MPVPGDALVTNRRRPILTLVEDTSPGVHDTLIAACDLFRYITLGVNEYHDNCSDNLRMAMMAIGLTTPEVPQPFNVWMNIPLAADWTIDWLPPVARPGDRTLRAEMDCIVVMSACPQDLVPINGEDMTPVELHAEVSNRRATRCLRTEPRLGMRGTGVLRRRARSGRSVRPADAHARRRRSWPGSMCWQPDCSR